MKLAGAQVIAADRMTVWNAINDPEILKQCIPGCEEMEKTSPTQFDAIVKQKVGPVSATFKGIVHLSDVDEGNSLRLSGEGKGGVAGMAKGGALVTLADVEGGTQLSYDAEASVAGKLAQLGSRLIDGVAQKMVGTFFGNFKDVVEGGSGMQGGATASSSSFSSSTSSASSSSSSSGAGMGGAAMAAATGMAGATAASASTRMGDMAQGSMDATTASASDTMQRGMDAGREAFGDATAEGMNRAGDAVQGFRDGAGDIVQGGMDAGRAGLDDAAAAGMDHARETAQGMRDGIDARAGALHDAAAERMLNPAIGAGAGEIDMDDPEIGDIDVSSVEGGPSEGEAMTASFDSARAAGSQAGDVPNADVAGNLRDMAGSFDADAAVGQVSDHVGAAGDAASGAAADAVNRVGEQVAASASDAQSQASAVAADAVNASRSGMDAGRDAAAGVAGSLGGAAAGMGAAGMAAASSSFDDARDSVTAGVSGHMDAAGDAARDIGASASASASGAMSSAEATARDGMDSGISIERSGDMRVVADTAPPETPEQEFNAGTRYTAETPPAAAEEGGRSRYADAAGAAAAAASAGIAGYAAKTSGKFDEVHTAARDRVIAAGGEVDEAKSWNDTKEHLGRAGSEVRDSAQDVYDAARARLDGDRDRATAEWNEAKTNASEAYGEAKGAAEDAWTTGKGYAAEQAKAPSVGPLGQPWYLWIIGIIVLLVLLWIL